MAAEIFGVSKVEKSNFYRRCSTEISEKWYIVNILGDKFTLKIWNLDSDVHTRYYSFLSALLIDKSEPYVKILQCAWFA